MFTHMHYDEADLLGIDAFARGSGKSFNEDQSLFAARALDYVKARVYNRKLTKMSGLALVPISNDTPEYAETITYRSYDAVGMAKIISNYAQDLPRVDVMGKEVTVRVKDIGDSYGYNINELTAAAATGTPLVQRKADAAAFAVDVKLNAIAMVGDLPYGLFGITNHPNIGLTAGLTGNWAAPATTAVQIVADFDTLFEAVVGQSNGTHRPTRAAIPLNALSAMKRKYMPADGGTKSAFAVVRENYPDIEIVGLPELQNVGGVSMAIFGEFTEENASLEMVKPFTQLPAQPRVLELVVPCHARTAGVVVHYPLAFTRATGL